ncbi:hypothetical protein D3C80_1990880 [compost metagenome]
MMMIENKFVNLSEGQMIEFRHVFAHCTGPLSIEKQEMRQCLSQITVLEDE